MTNRSRSLSGFFETLWGLSPCDVYDVSVRFTPTPTEIVVTLRYSQLDNARANCNLRLWESVRQARVRVGPRPRRSFFAVVSHTREARHDKRLKLRSSSIVRGPRVPRVPRGGVVHRAQSPPRARVRSGRGVQRAGARRVPRQALVHPPLAPPRRAMQPHLPR